MPQRRSTFVAQSRLMSLVEALANVAVGFAVAVATQTIVFPLFGLMVDMGTNFAIGLIFTALSIVRSFLLRRLFETVRGAERVKQRRRPVQGGG